MLAEFARARAAQHTMLSSEAPPYVPRGDCTVEMRRRTPTATCPRCQEVAGAGVCPAPGSVGSLAREFDQVFVLCMGTSCLRHRTGYWPPGVHRKLTAFDAVDMDRTLSEEIGPQASQLLRIGANRSQHRSRATPGESVLRHRVLALLAHLQLVAEAKRRGLQSVLILEADVRPLSNTRYELQPDAVAEIADALRSREWSVLRLGGQFTEYAWSRNPAECPAGCACTPVTRRTCEIRPPPAWGGAYCKVKDTVAYAVHRRAYGAFASARHRALRALQRAVRTEAFAVNGLVGVNPNGAGAGCLGWDSPSPNPNQGRGTFPPRRSMARGASCRGSTCGCRRRCRASTCCPRSPCSRPSRATSTRP